MEDINRTLGLDGYDASCAKEIQPMLKAFFDKALSSVDWGTGHNAQYYRIEDIVEAVCNLAKNTCPNERMSEKDVKSFKKLLEEFYILLDEILENCDYNNLYKFECLQQIVCNGMHDSEEEHENWRDGMIFQDLENLWKIVHRVNTQWNDLYSRGFSLSVFNSFWNDFNDSIRNGEKLSEEEKFNAFMELMDELYQCIVVSSVY